MRKTGGTLFKISEMWYNIRMKCAVQAPGPETLERARQLIAAEELVAFPTETVYGLGASALSDRAIRRIYEVKGRPQDNPLIVHTWSPERIPEIGRLTPLAERLAEAFMPGPITLVIERRPEICARVSAGLGTVAVRVPGHAVARAFLRAVEVPIAAPSANSSTRPSPTCAAHVLHDLGDKIPLIVDGGSCEVGIESTVVDATGERPRILRPGIITEEEIGRIAPVDRAGSADPAVRSPGVKYKHYAPACEVRLFRSGDLGRMQAYYEGRVADRPVFLCSAASAEKLRGDKLVLGHDEREIAHALYARLLEAERNFGLILLEACPDTEIGRSVNNRMFKTGGSRWEGEDV